MRVNSHSSILRSDIGMFLYPTWRRRMTRRRRVLLDLNIEYVSDVAKGVLLPVFSSSSVISTSYIVAGVGTRWEGGKVE
jgi:hypothetical protein